MMPLRGFVVVLGAFLPCTMLNKISIRVISYVVGLLQHSSCSASRKKCPHLQKVRTPPQEEVTPKRTTLYLPALELLRGLYLTSSLVVVDLPAALPSSSYVLPLSMNMAMQQAAFAVCWDDVTCRNAYIIWYILRIVLFVMMCWMANHLTQLRGGFEWRVSGTLTLKVGYPLNPKHISVSPRAQTTYTS